MQLGPDGAQRFHCAVDENDLMAIRLTLQGTGPRGSPGLRLPAGRLRRSLLVSAGAIAASVLGMKARPVSAKFFDKSPDRNWALGWHQDRTIAVRQRIDTPGFTAWSLKQDIHHVVPPFPFLERMLTLRIHLDAVGRDNAPLLVAPGSHRLGSISVPEIPAAIARLGTAACEAAAGDVWLYSTPILHASARAEHPSRRRVLQLLYSADQLPDGLEWLGV